MKPSFLSEPSRGFTLIPAIGISDYLPHEVRHQFCGRHEITGAWCPNCDKPLLLMVDFDASDPRLGLNPTWRRFPLLYCWTCEREQDVFSYRVAGHQKIEIISDFRGEHIDDFPYADYPESFEQLTVLLADLSQTDQLAIRALNRGTDDLPFFRMRSWLCETIHQVGGEPLLMQGIDDFVPRCPVCSLLMPHFASIGNSNMSPKGFVDSPGVQVLFNLCRKCSVVSAVNRTD